MAPLDYFTSIFPFYCYLCKAERICLTFRFIVNIVFYFLLLFCAPMGMEYFSENCEVMLCIVVVCKKKICMCPFDHIVVIKVLLLTTSPWGFFSRYSLVFEMSQFCTLYYFVTYPNIFNKHLTNSAWNSQLICKWIPKQIKN